MLKRISKILIAIILLAYPIVAIATPDQLDFLISGLRDSSGNALSGGKVYTYIAGTTTNKDTWQDIAKATPHANPIILDGNGKKQVYADGLYKIVIADSADNILYTHDNLYFSNFSGPTTWAGETTGSSNAYVATLTPALLALTDGSRVSFIANHTNTSTATLNVNSLGAIAIERPDGTALVAKDIIDDYTYNLVYSTIHASWVLLNPSWGYTTWTPTITPSAGSVASQTQTCNYSRQATKVFVMCVVSWTQGSASATYIDATLPVAPAATNQNLSAFTIDDGTSVSGFSFVQSVSSNGTLRIARYDNGNLTTGTLGVFFSGVYFTS